MFWVDNGLIYEVLLKETMCGHFDQGCEMTSRERVVKALTFDRPDRAPRDLWVLPGAQLHQRAEIDDLRARYPMDFSKASNSPGTNKTALDDPDCVGSYVDDWGSVWERAEPGVIGEVKVPALVDWTTLDHYQLPWHLIKDRSFDEVNRSCADSDLFVLSAVTARPFERYQFLRGSENTFLDIGYASQSFQTLLQMIHAFYLEDVRGWCKSDVDGLVLMDDWGAQQQVLISPQTWREVFKPLYRDYCDLIHQAGKYVFFHTDGFTQPLWEDLIEVGVDAINAQLFTMDIEKLAEQFCGRVTLWGEIDRQHVLPFGTPEDVAQAVKRVRSAFDSGKGGVIAQCEWGICNPPENIAAVFQAWL